MERKPTRHIAPDWCREICINSGRPGCVYDCAEERKGRYFVPDPDLTLEDIAPFPIHDWQVNSSPKERQAIAGLYLSKLVETITGVAQDPDLQLLKKELAAASDERLMEIVTEILEDTNQQGSNGTDSGRLSRVGQKHGLQPKAVGETMVFQTSKDGQDQGR